MYKNLLFTTGLASMCKQQGKKQNKQNPIQLVDKLKIIE